MLKVVLLGYGELAQSLALGILQTNHKIIGVMRWERPGVNGFIRMIRDTFAPDTLLSIIRANNLREIKAKRANSKAFIKEMQRLKPDVIIVGSWGEILKKEVLDLPKLAFINCHPSLLPKHRGSNPYVSAIKIGETGTGVTFHIVNEKIDAGDILLQAEVAITGIDTGETLKNKCAFKAKESVKVLLSGLEQGNLIPLKQNEAEASYFPAISEDDAFINWKKPAEEIHNHIRALYPWIKCYTPYKDGFLFINSSRVIDLQTPVHKPGVIIEDNKDTKKEILVSTSEPCKALLCRGVELYDMFYALKNLFR